jgi:uncharacterized protein YqhQ
VSLLFWHTQNDDSNPSARTLIETKDMNVGGQAVIEGVMMRSPQIIATAVRLPNGAIEVKRQPYVTLTKRYRILNIPILRGAINFFEVLIIGFDTLNWSADIQMEYEEKKEGKKVVKPTRYKNMLILGGTMIIAFSLALAIFFALPIYIATLLGLTRGAVLFNIVAGTIRITLFLIYIFVVTKIPDMKRIFRYHGAEHMSIFALESSGDLTVNSARKKSRFHPRCGTSFLLIVAFFSIFLFGIADSLFPVIFGHLQSIGERLITHLLLLPFVGGVSYEALKLSGRFRSSLLVKILIAPGLWLQTMTTGEPDDDMLEVAICALKSALDQKVTES